MQGTLDSNFLLFDLEIEKTTRRLCKETKERRKTQLEAVENPHNEGHGVILRILKLGLSWTIPFQEFMGVVQLNGVSEDAIWLRLFPFSVKDKAKHWLDSLATSCISTWADLVQKFLTRYVSPSKSAKLRIEITSFHRQEGEPLSDAWEHYNEILRQCPHYSFEFWIQVQSFYNGLLPHARSMVDATAGGALNFKTSEQAWDLLEMMANNEYQRQGERVVVKKGIMEVNTLNALLAQNKIMTQQLVNLSKKVKTLNISAYVKAITTRSGKVRKESNDEESREKPCGNLSSNEDASNESNEKQSLHGREPGQESSSKGKKKVEVEEKSFGPLPFIKVPFPQRLRKQQDESNLENS
ncbi:hypothetical protein L6164_033378 [Bauhinia variegata]|uniref:Uncharacterized protein n=1 Tax=Bauhinia variegata TaxID=167791 RepID=A0ACB9KRR2_BAUVA|nr:hypothetical protein L6164_033378 [Bauhinia variegata]